MLRSLAGKVDGGEGQTYRRQSEAGPPVWQLGRGGRIIAGSIHRGRFRRARRSGGKRKGCESCGCPRRRASRPTRNASPTSALEFNRIRLERIPSEPWHVRISVGLHKAADK